MSAPSANPPPLPPPVTPARDLRDDMEAWHAANSHYLAASLQWLRARLEALAASLEMDGRTERAAANGETPSGRSWFRLFGPVRPAAAAHSTPAERIERAAAERAAAEQVNPPPVLLLLSRVFGMSPFERDLLLLCAAMDLDTRIPALCAQALGQPEQRYPTFALALTLLDQPAWEALSPPRPLRYWRLLEIHSADGAPLVQNPLRADERIVSYLKGLNVLDERLTAVGSLGGLANRNAALAPSQQAVVEAILKRWRRPGDGSVRPVVLLLGLDAEAKESVATAVAVATHRQLLRVTVEALPTTVTETEALARLWLRDTLLLPLALYLDARNAEAPEVLATVDRFLSRAAGAEGLILVGAREALPRLSADHWTVDIAKPTRTEQLEAWEAALAAPTITLAAEGRSELSRCLAGQFNLNWGEIRRLVSDEAEGDQTHLPERLWQACRMATRPRLEALAQRLEPKVVWDDLVVLDEPRRLLRAIVDQVRQRATVYEDWGFARKMNRGLGISALFTGESGTGKTMAAEVLADELALDLYRIDLSAVVSKYIGETEKNLRRLFDAAEDGGAILFFDEADALFGKRSEVKDSHDRYANIEVNYLLQRMESYRGLAILATNMRRALDDAFVRRLRFIVPFAYPSTPERRLIWQKAFPADVPLATLDYDRLARFNLTGANIHSIALNAAFLAAQSAASVTMNHVLGAVRMELRKLEKPINEAELRP